MKGKILRVLVGIFPSYLCLYADSLTMATDILLSVTLIAAIVTGILTNCTDEDKKDKLTDILQDLWICHLSAFAICIFIQSL
jgi:hypothetical protein